MEEITKIIGFDVNNLPENDFNKDYDMKIKVRALFKIMLYVHATLNFERMFDPDLNNHVRRYSPHTKQIEDYFPISYDPSVYTDNRMANCSVYSHYFESLAKSLGFEVRHIGLKGKDGRSGHWCSEVRICEEWIFFDPMYLICSIDETGKYYSAKDIMSDPMNRYFKLIPPTLRGVSETTIMNLWSGLEINKETTYKLGQKQFLDKYYGK